MRVAGKAFLQAVRNELFLGYTASMLLYPSLLPVFDSTGEVPEPLLKAAHALQNAGVDGLHLDFMAPPTMPRHTFSATFPTVLREGGVTLPLDIHLMTPAAWITDMSLHLVNSLTFHPKSVNNKADILNWFAFMQNKCPDMGIALDVEEDVEPFAEILAHPHCRRALIMTVQAGAGGQAFNSAMLDKIQQVKAINPHLTVMVDGGINAQSWPLAQAAGADAAVVGSALFKTQDIEYNIKVLKNII